MTLAKKDSLKKIRQKASVVGTSTEFQWLLVGRNTSLNLFSVNGCILITEFGFHTHFLIAEDFNSFFMLDFFNNFNIFAPKCFGYWESDEKSNKMSLNLKLKFLRLAFTDKSSSEGMGRVVSDGFIGYPIYKFVESVSSSVDVYYYISPGQFILSFVFWKLFISFRIFQGLTHGDELDYFTPTSDRVISLHLMKNIEHFSLTG